MFAQVDAIELVEEIVIDNVQMIAKEVVIVDARVVKVDALAAAMEIVILPVNTPARIVVKTISNNVYK